MLGSRIAALRRKAGMSQAALSKRLCVTPSTVGMYEQGRRAPSYDTLIMLSKEFDVSVDYLLTGTIHSENEFETAVGILFGTVQEKITAETINLSIEPISKEAVILKMGGPIVSENNVMH